MATRTLYFTAPVLYGAMSIQDGGTAPTPGITGTGWAVGKIAVNYQALMQAGTERLTSALATADALATPAFSASSCFRSEVPFNGNFAAGNWTLKFILRSVTASASQRGRMKCRIWKSKAVNGSDAVELTTGVLTGTATANALNTVTSNWSDVVWSAPAVAMEGEHLWVQCEWQITTAGTNNSSDANIYIESAGGITTPDYVEQPHGTGVLVPTGPTYIANYCRNTEALDVQNYGWTTTQASVTANTEMAPNSTLTADTLTDNSASNIHNIYHNGVTPVPAGGGLLTFSIFAKAGTCSWIQMTAGGPTASGYANFNVATGVVGRKGDAGVIASIADAGNGWYRCSVSFFVPAGSYASQIWMSPNDATGWTPVYVGTGSTVHLWGGQIEFGAPTPYQPNPTNGWLYLPIPILAGTGSVVDLEPQDDAWDRMDRLAMTLSNDDKTATATVNTNGVRSRTHHDMGSPGKWYAEFVLDDVNLSQFGINDVGGSLSTAALAFANDSNGTATANGSFVPGAGLQTPIDDGMVIGLAWDAGNKLLWFTKDGVKWNNDYPVVASPAAGVGGISCAVGVNGPFALWFRSSTKPATTTIRTEKDEFTYNAPIGFKSWMGESFGDSGVLSAVGTVLASAGKSSSVGTGPMTQPAHTMAGVGVVSSVSTSAALTALKYTRANLVLQSQDYNQSPWVSTAITVSANAAMAPDGTMTAETIDEGTTTALHYVYQTVNTGVGILTYSVHLKAGTGTHFKLMMAGSSQHDATFNLVNGTVGSVSFQTTASIEALANGWYRCSVAMQVPSVNATVNVSNILMDDDPGSINHIGTNRTFHVWGGQVELGSVPTAYIPTTTVAVTVSPTLIATGTQSWNATGALVAGVQRTNLLKYSAAFENAAWGLNAATVTANAIAAPDATVTADRLNDGITTSNHYIYQNNVPMVAGSVYTTSVYAKYGTVPWFGMMCNIGGNLHQALFNVQTGALGVTTAGVTSRIEALANGWYRCSATWPVAGSTGVGFTHLVMSQTDNLLAGSSYLGANGYTYVWGMQHEASALPTTYIPTDATAVTVGAPSTMTGAGKSEIVGTGNLTSVSTITSAGVGSSSGTGAMPSASAVVFGKEGDTLRMSPFTLSATGMSFSFGAAVLVSQDFELLGSQFPTFLGGQLWTGKATMTGAGISSAGGRGDLLPHMYDAA